MKKPRLLILMPVLLLCLVAAKCPDEKIPEQIARDAVAASKGAIQTAQAKYLATCRQDASQPPCLAIDRAVHAQNVAVDALSVYCQFTPASPAEAKCRPVQSAYDGLKSAVGNLDQSTVDVKELIQ